MKQQEPTRAALRSHADAAIPRQMWLNPKTELRASHRHGTGLFATQSIEPGEIVEVWGERWEGRQVIEYTRDHSEAAAASDRGMLVMRFDTDLWSIEPPGDNPGYFINHSCDSNVWMEGAFTLVARRPVEPGEELTIDYALIEAELDVWDFECDCGSPLCRRIIKGDDWHLPDLQQRYRDHFTPYITKLIEGGRPT
jgi:SET domain-containing protein